jgi:hypothetical protein
MHEAVTPDVSAVRCRCERPKTLRRLPPSKAIQSKYIFLRAGWLGTLPFTYGSAYNNGMLHNTLYRFQRGQRKTIFWLALLFLALSLAWWIAEIIDWWFPLEPPVVFVGGLTTLAAIYWPFKASNANGRKSGRNTFAYKSNNGEFTIGHGETEITVKFSNASGTEIHVYSDCANIRRIALATGVGQISEIKDVAVFDYSNRVVTPKEGQIVCLENKAGNYGCIHIHDIKAESHGDRVSEVTFSYTLNEAGGLDFS